MKKDVVMLMDEALDHLIRCHDAVEQYYEQQSYVALQEDWEEVFDAFTFIEDCLDYIQNHLLPRLCNIDK